MATIFKIVGGNIRRMRKSKRLTLEQLAEKAESNPKYLGGVERGEENIGLKKLQQVAVALRVDPYELLLPGGEGELTEELIASIKTADARRRLSFWILCSGFRHGGKSSRPLGNDGR